MINNSFNKLAHPKIIKGIKKLDIIKSLSNTLQVTFEVTEKCNLECKYCSYGELYSGKNSTRIQNDLPTIYAKKLLDYLVNLWNSNANKSYKKTVSISFYGGEPLMNVPFIKEVINYVKKANLECIIPRFNMTTNAVLLKKHIAFLVENDFHLLISLDGNKENNSYRVYKNGKESFDDIIKNIDFVYKNYPDFFKTNIQFNSVLHNRSSFSETFNYIFNRYNKKPTITELNTSGIEESKKTEFWNTYVNLTESLNQSEDYRFIRDTLFIDSPDISQLSTAIHHSSNNVYQTYLDFFTKNETKEYLPTGTCIPFSRKIFLTAKGTILQCERISDAFPFGKVTEEGVFIDYDKILDITNNTYDKLAKYCNNCIRKTNCTQCIFNLDLSAEKISCPGYLPNNKFKLSYDWITKALKEDRKLYKKILTEVYYE